MIKENTIYCEDCFETMKQMEHGEVDMVITSPPYNMTKRKGGISDSGRYDVYEDWKTEEEYLDWTVRIFNKFNDVVKEDGVVLYNFSYSIENPSLPYKMIAEIEKRTDYRLVDTIIWKKSSGIPFPANKYRLSRIFEFIFVFVEKDHINSYVNNRPIKSVSEKTGQSYYEVFYNFVEAPNNDGKCPYNQATYSSTLVERLLQMYCPIPEGRKPLIYDPFMGSGSTAVGCIKYGVDFCGSEISQKQVDYANERINGLLKR